MASKVKWEYVPRGRVFDFLFRGGDAASWIGFERFMDRIDPLIVKMDICWRPRENGKSGRLRLTPAMSVGLTNTLWKMEDLYDRVT